MANHCSWCIHCPSQLHSSKQIQSQESTQLPWLGTNAAKQGYNCNCKPSSMAPTVCMVKRRDAGILYSSPQTERPYHAVLSVCQLLVESAKNWAGDTGPGLAGLLAHLLCVLCLTCACCCRAPLLVPLLLSCLAACAAFAAVWPLPCARHPTSCSTAYPPVVLNAHLSGLHPYPAGPSFLCVPVNHLPARPIYVSSNYQSRTHPPHRRYLLRTR